MIQHKQHVRRKPRWVKGDAAYMEYFDPNLFTTNRDPYNNSFFFYDPDTKYSPYSLDEDDEYAWDMKNFKFDDFNTSLLLDRFETTSIDDILMGKKTTVMIEMPIVEFPKVASASINKRRIKLRCDEYLLPLVYERQGRRRRSSSHGTM